MIVSVKLFWIYSKDDILYHQFQTYAATPPARATCQQWHMSTCQFGGTGDDDRQYNINLDISCPKNGVKRVKYYKSFLVGAWTNPFEKYDRQIFDGEMIVKQIYLKPPPSFTSKEPAIIPKQQT